MSENTFVAAPFFFLRTPTWSIEAFEHILAQENWIDALIGLYESNQLLREAVSIASPSLYHSLKQKPLKNPKQAALSLFNYVIRMATRPTPFGLFSCVTSGTWKQQTEVHFDVNKVTKKARPDMEWVFALIQKLYKDKELFSSLPVQTNPLVSFRGGRYYLEYIRHFVTNTLSPKTLSVNDNPLVANILLLAKECITIQDLWDKLKSKMVFLDQIKTFQIIESLLDQQLILPGLLPSLLDPGAWESLLCNLPAKIKGKALLDSIHTYDKLKPGKGEVHLLDLQNRMKEWVSSKTFLQVDSAYEGSQHFINKEVVEELEQAVNISWKISTALNPSNKLKVYLQRFIEKYGTQRTVPLMELLCENGGIGSHEKILESPPPPSKFSKEWEKWLSYQWQKCLVEKKNEITITAQGIEDLFELAKERPPDPKRALLSFDIFCKIFAESSDKIDNGEFLLLLSSHNWRGGASLGRFMHLFSKELQKDLKEYFRREEKLEKETLFVELSYWPSCIRNANVAIQPCLRDYRLDIEEKKCKKGSLSLSDIYVGALADRFYLTLKDGQQEIIPCFGNFLNPGFAPLPFRFMREVLLSRHQLFYLFSSEESVKNAVFFPRVRYQKTVLSPAQWNFDAKPFIDQKLEKIVSAFKLWADQWQLPCRFFMVKNDQQLLFDRRHPVCLEILATKLKNGESLKLIEAIDSPWLKSKQGHHFAEIIVPFLKNPIYAENEKSFTPLSYKEIPFEKRNKLPGSEWLFIKFYLDEENVERFLVQYLSQLADYLVREKGGIGWFFVRYKDPENHVRFRMRFRSTELAAKSLEVLEEVSRDWMKKGLVKNIVFSVYEREVERYGGLDFIEDSELFFFQDTLTTIKLLQDCLDKSIPYHSAVFQSISIISFLRSFELDDEEIITFLGNKIIDRSKLDGFRNHKNQLIKLLIEIENYVEDFSSIAARKIIEASDQRVEVFNLINSKLKNISNFQRFNICSSMLHLHCNRLGCDVNEESKAYLYARHALIQLKHLQNSRNATSNALTIKGV